MKCAFLQWMEATGNCKFQILSTTAMATAGPWLGICSGYGLESIYFCIYFYQSVILKGKKKTKKIPGYDGLKYFQTSTDV